MTRLAAINVQKINKNKNQQNTCRCYKSVRLCSTSSATAFVNKFPSL